MQNISKFLYFLAIFLCVILFSFAFYFAEKMYQLSKQVDDQSIPVYKYHFVLVPEEMDNDYWRLVENGAKSAAEKYGVLLEYIGPKQANVDDHLQKLNIAAATKVDGIMTQGLNDEQYTPMINKLVDKGIPVITVDTDAPHSNRAAYIGTDNYYSGFIAGKALISDTKGKVNVGIITGGFQSSHQQLRVQGFRDAVAIEDRVHIIAIEESKITRINAAEMADKILTEYPETNAFFGTSALDGIGIAEAVTQLDRAGQTYIIAFDTIDGTLDYIKKDIIHATVIQKPYEMGYRAIEMMINIKEGNGVSKINFTETKVIYKNDLAHLFEELQKEKAK